MRVYMERLCVCTEASLTIAVDGKGCVWGDDVVVADLAVLWRAVLVPGLHLKDAVIDLPLRQCGVVHRLPEHWSKLIHIIHLDMHHRPEREGGRGGGERRRE